jgi:hypothetical protein
MLDLSCFRCAVQGGESCKRFTPCLVQGKERKAKIIKFLYYVMYLNVINSDKE